MSEHIFTVGELRKMLEGFSDGTELEIAGGLTIHRVKSVDDRTAWLEFNQQAYSPHERPVGVELLAAFYRE